MGQLMVMATPLSLPLPESAGDDKVKGTMMNVANDENEESEVSSDSD